MGATFAFSVTSTQGASTQLSTTMQLHSRILDFDDDTMPSYDTFDDADFDMDLLDFPTLSDEQIQLSALSPETLAGTTDMEDSMELYEPNDGLQSLQSDEGCSDEDDNEKETEEDKSRYYPLIY